MIWFTIHASMILLIFLFNNLTLQLLNNGLTDENMSVVHCRKMSFWLLNRAQEQKSFTKPIVHNV